MHLFHPHYYPLLSSQPLKSISNCIQSLQQAIVKLNSMLSADAGVRLTEKKTVFTPKVWNNRPLFTSTLKSLKEEHNDEHTCVPDTHIPLARYEKRQLR